MTARVTFLIGASSISLAANSVRRVRHQHRETESCACFNAVLRRALAHAEVQSAALEHEPQRRGTDLVLQLLRRSARARRKSGRPAPFLESRGVCSSDRDKAALNFTLNAG